MPPLCERNEETTENTQDFDWIRHKYEDHICGFVAQLDSSFRKATLEQAETWSKMEKADGAIWKETVGFIRWEKKVSNSSKKRRIQGIFVGHHDRTRAIPYIAKSGIVRSNKSDQGRP